MTRIPLRTLCNSERSGGGSVVRTARSAQEGTSCSARLLRPARNSHGKRRSNKMHNLVVSCVVVVYLSANVYAIVKVRVFELARSRKHLLLYGVPFILWGALILLGCKLMEIMRRFDKWAAFNGPSISEELWRYARMLRPAATASSVELRLHPQHILVVLLRSF